MITEQDIQKAFTAHLREFYKYRYEYEPGTWAEANDALAQGGIIADGMVSFDKPDGSKFVSTFEATSLDKSGEVKFKQNAIYFLWDCFAFASLVTGAVLGYMYLFQFLNLSRLGLAGMIGLIFTMFLFAFSVWYFGMSSWRKYRYIYAIEQFKQYFADEQWIVLGYDVFPNPEDPYLKELRSQCTFSGFGLAVVDYSNGVRIVSTPSRLGIYGQDRADANWLTGTTAYAQMRQQLQRLPEAPGPVKQLWNFIVRPIQYLFIKPLTNLIWRIAGGNHLADASEFNRFMRSFSYQKGLSLLGMAATALLFFNTVQTEGFHSDAEYDVFSKFQERRPKDYVNPEDQAGYVTAEHLPITYGKPTGVPKQYSGDKVVNTTTKSANTNHDGIETDDKVQEIDLTSLREDEDTAKAKAPSISNPVKYSETADAGSLASKGVKTTPSASSSTWDWCKALAGKSGYFVQDNYFLAAEGADLRVKALRAKGFTCFTVKANCLGFDKKGTYVFLKELFLSENAAAEYLRKAIADLKKKDMDTGRTIVRKWPATK